MGLWDAFTGKSQANDIERGRAEADEALRRGLGQLTTTRENYLGRSLGEFDAVQPDIAMGRSANSLYGNALGLNGRDAQAGYFNDFQNDPGFQALQDQAVGAVETSAANRGGLLSGSTLKGITDRVGLLKKSMFDDRMNRLAQLGTQGAQLGFNTATSRSNLLNSTGTDIGNAQFGTGQLFANNATSSANALAQSRSIPINNLLAVGKLGVSLATGGMSDLASAAGGYLQSGTNPFNSDGSRNSYYGRG